MKRMIVSSMVIAVLSSACGSPTAPSGSGIGAPIFSPQPPVVGYKTYTPSSWDPLNELPSVPPNECDCLAGNWPPTWNGHNWVCGAEAQNRILPAKNNFCNVEHAR